MQYHMYKLYALVGYAFSMAVLTYYMGWLLGVIVPYTVDGPMIVNLTGGNVVTAVIINLLLLAQFAVQHSIMARPAFKEKWLTIIPKTMERATYVLASGVSLFILMVFWQTVPGMVWTITFPILVYVIYAVYLLGVLILVGATFCIDHFELFGLKQGFAKQGQAIEPPPFIQRGLYTLVRHPIMTGLFIMFWATPMMSVSHLFYSVISTIYIVHVIYKYEEKDLADYIGPEYVEYKKKVPAFFPFKMNK